MATLFPMFVKLEGRRCLVVGAGKVAESKIAGLLETGAHVHVVATHATQVIVEWAQRGLLELHIRPFAANDLDGIFLVVAATSSPHLHEAIFREAARRGVLCNVVDVPELCDFYYGAVVRRGDLQIAISTNGQSPALASRLREQLEQQFGDGYADWVAELGETRRLILASDLAPQRKRELLLSLSSREAFEAVVQADSKIVTEEVV